MAKQHHFHLAVVSGNKKTGPIAVTTSSRSTCPTSCPLRGAGCYADAFPMRLHWDRLSAGESRAGTDLSGLAAKLRALPAGAMLRHNQAGDLPGVGDRIAPRQLEQLADAASHLNAFTYTHKPMTAGNRAAVAQVNQARAERGSGLTVNLSADTLAEADTLADTGAGPVVVVLPVDQTTRTATPAGRTVIVCPATQRDDVTCESCGICAHPTRKAIVGFPAHGPSRRRVGTLAQG